MEDLTREELVAGPAVEGFDEGVLPRAARFDVHGAGAARPAPVANRGGDELWTIVHADELGGSSDGFGLVQDLDHVVGFDRALEVASDVLAGQLVAHGKGLEGP